MVEKDEGVMIRIPKNLKKRLEALKIHRRQPIYEVVESLLDAYQKKEEVSGIR
jgi:hypothetical protein